MEERGTCLVVVRCTNGVCFPSLGGAVASASIDGVKVAVNKHVCRSFGMASNNCASSGAKLGVSRRSASSKTYCAIIRNNKSGACRSGTDQKPNPRKVPFPVTTVQQVDEASWSSNYYVWSVVQFQGLFHHVHSSYYHSRPYTDRGTKNSKLLCDLKC